MNEEIRKDVEIQEEELERVSGGNEEPTYELLPGISGRLEREDTTTPEPVCWECGGKWIKNTPTWTCSKCGLMSFFGVRG